MVSTLTVNNLTARTGSATGVGLVQAISKTGKIRTVAETRKRRVFMVDRANKAQHILMTDWSVM